ncbi:MAG TPA: phosphoribosylglycinamide formyltransferase [Cyanobacteria bacterium UBA9971]|nr:phosphoribosylglycinamide formyltransferase [Cyanobacteria bacterium UBA9971]
MPAREEVKYLLLKKKMTIIELAKELTEKTGHKYTRQGISNKLHRGTLRFDEVEEIAKILGYEIKFKEISD